jgi:hypothetical protein
MDYQQTTQQRSGVNERIGMKSLVALHTYALARVVVIDDA